LAPRKKIIEPDDKEIINSEEDVMLALRFAEALGLNIYPSAFNPQLVNARMRDIGLLTTGGVTPEKVTKALDNPKSSERELLAISESFEYTSTPYKRLLNYMADILSWDFTYTCKNIKDISEYKSTEYKKDLNVVKDFFLKFDHKKEFQTILKQLYRQEAYFSVLRDEGELYVMQELDPTYCLITGRWDYGFLFSFNYIYFQQGGIDINMFPPVFKETYQKIFTNNNANSYNPSASIDDRGNSLWVQYADCSPKSGFWAFKLQNQQATRIPYFSGLFPDFANQNTIRNLQKSSYMSAAIKLLSGQIPMISKETSAKVKDAFAISPENLKPFLQLLRSAINESVNVITAPLNDIKGIEYSINTDISSSWNKDTIGKAGVNSALLYGSEQKMNQMETLLSVDVDSFVSEEVYPWFNKFLEYQINDRTKKYKFKIDLEGTSFHTDIQRRREAQSSLMGVGIVLPQKIAAAHQMNPFSFQAQLDEARANGWVDNLTPIVPAAQQAAGAQAGRPSKSQDKLSESGEETQSAGSNLSKVKKNK
jgi:hypothetical protein